MMSQQLKSIYTILLMSQICIYFSVTAETKLGEELRICGNAKDLGNWNINNSHRLNTNEGIYPQWKSLSPIKVRAHSLFQFKVFVSDSMGKLVRWQTIHQNRMAFLAQPSMVVFQMNSVAISFVPVANEHRENRIHELPVRKGTQEILRDIDPYSDSSSGNERRWEEINPYRQRESFELLNVFMEEAKKLFQYASVNDHTLIKSMNSSSHHEKCRSLENVMVISPHHFDPELCGENSCKKPSEKLKQISLTQFQQIHLESEKYSAYHFLYSDKQANTLSQVKDANQMIIFHLDNRQLWPEKEANSAIQKLLNFSCCQVINTTSEDKVFKITKYCQANGIKTRIQSERVIRIDKPDDNYLYLIYSEQESSYSSIYEQINFKFPASCRARKLLQPSSFKDLNKKKLCLIVRCLSLSEISQLVINHLILLSSQKNIQVYFFTSDEANCKKKVPFSQRDKFLIISTYGEVISYDGKSENFLDALNLQEDKYRHFYDNFVQKIQAWKTQIISVNNLKNIMQISLLASHMSQLICDYLQEQIQKNNQTSRFKILMQKVEGQTIEIVLKPFILSDFFFARLLAAVNDHDDYQPQFISFDFTRDKKLYENFTKSLETVCGSKGIKYEGFHVQENPKYDSISQQKVQKIFDRVLDAAQKSSIRSGNNSSLFGND